MLAVVMVYAFSKSVDFFYQCVLEHIIRNKVNECKAKKKGSSKRMEGVSIRMKIQIPFQLDQGIQ